MEQLLCAGQRYGNTKSYFNYRQHPRFTKYPQEAVRNFFYHRDLTEDSFDAFSVEEWVKAFEFRQDSRTEVFLPEVLNQSIAEGTTTLYAEEDAPFPSYAAFESCADIESWTTQAQEKIAIKAYGENQQVLEQSLLPSIKTAHSVQAKVLYEGMICPSANSIGIDVEIMSMYLIAPSTEQIDMVQKTLGVMNERELVDVRQSDRMLYLNQHPDTQLAAIYSSEDLIGASWAWNGHDFPDSVVLS